MSVGLSFDNTRALAYRRIRNGNFIDSDFITDVQFPSGTQTIIAASDAAASNTLAEALQRLAAPGVGTSYDAIQIAFPVSAQEDAADETDHTFTGEIFAEFPLPATGNGYQGIIVDPDTDEQSRTVFDEDSDRIDFELQTPTIELTTTITNNTAGTAADTNGYGGFGDTFTITATLNNTSDETATNLVWRLADPDSVVSSANARVSINGSDQGLFNALADSPTLLALPDLAGGMTHTITVGPFEATACTDDTFTAAISYGCDTDHFDIDALQDSSDVPITLAPALPGSAGAVHTSTTAAGGRLDIRIDLSNEGGSLSDLALAYDFSDPFLFDSSTGSWDAGSSNLGAPTLSI